MPRRVVGKEMTLSALGRSNVRWISSGVLTGPTIPARGEIYAADNPANATGGGPHRPPPVFRLTATSYRAFRQQLSVGLNGANIPLGLSAYSQTCKS
jgi:hypothetical protein